MLLVHMGGPFWERREEGAWTVPKGEHEPSEEPLQAARREFEEELGRPLPEGPVTSLGVVRQAGGKEVAAFAVRGDFDAADITSNVVEMEWPRGSGRVVRFPEVDRAQWFGLEEAARLLIKGQVPLLARLAEQLASTET